MLNQDLKGAKLAPLGVFQKLMICVVPVSRFECVSGLSVYWPIIALGTRECGVAKLFREPTVQSEFFFRVSLLKTFN